MIKPELRRELRAQLRKLSEEKRSHASAAIRRTLAAHPALGNARCIAVFDPLPGEPEITSLPADLAAAGSPHRANFAFPRREEDTLAFYIVDTPTHLETVEGFRFREPDPARCPRIPLSEIDVILVPGLAFTPAGDGRLGQGGGCYDRILAAPGLRATRLGVCFADQLRDELPMDPHDQGVDEVITEG